jgi:hypothetical protein
MCGWIKGVRKKNTRTNQKQLQQWCGLIKMHQQTCATMVWMDQKCTNLTKHMNKLKTAAIMRVDGSNACTNKQATRTSNKFDYWKDRDRDLQL